MYKHWLLIYMNCNIDNCEWTWINIYLTTNQSFSFVFKYSKRTCCSSDSRVYKTPFYYTGTLFYYTGAMTSSTFIFLSLLPCGATTQTTTAESVIFHPMEQIQTSKTLSESESACYMLIEILGMYCLLKIKTASFNSR